MDVELLLHVEPVDDGEEGRNPELAIAWWAESPQLPGWTAVAPSLAELRVILHEMLEAERPDVIIVKETLVVPHATEGLRAPRFSQSGDSSLAESEGGPDVRPMVLLAT